MTDPQQVMRVISGQETEALLEELRARAEREKAERAEKMPTEQHAINQAFQAWLRLKELGWCEAIYCPKDGTPFYALEPGCTDYAYTTYMGEWPKGCWMAHIAGDLWPSYPMLFKPLNPQQRGEK
jgi:hypothetical protein